MQSHMVAVGLVDRAESLERRETGLLKELMELKKQLGKGSEALKSMKQAWKEEKEKVKSLTSKLEASEGKVEELKMQAASVEDGRKEVESDLKRLRDEKRVLQDEIVELQDSLAEKEANTDALYASIEAFEEDTWRRCLSKVQERHPGIDLEGVVFSPNGGEGGEEMSAPETAAAGESQPTETVLAGESQPTSTMQEGEGVSGAKALKTAAETGAEVARGIEPLTGATAVKGPGDDAPAST